MLSRAGLWSSQLPRFAWCLGAIGLRLDYGDATVLTRLTVDHPPRVIRAHFASPVFRTPNVTGGQCLARRGNSRDALPSRMALCSASDMPPESGPLLYVTGRPPVLRKN